MASRAPEGDPLTNIRRGELKRILRHNGVSEIELRNRVEDILAERPKWTGVALGRRIGLTFEKKLLLGIRTIQCMDKTPAEVKAYFRERKRTRDRLRKKRLRQMARPADSLSVRARDLLAVLDGEWIRSPDLAQRVEKRNRFAVPMVAASTKSLSGKPCIGRAASFAVSDSPRKAPRWGRIMSAFVKSVSVGEATPFCHGDRRHRDKTRSLPSGNPR